MIEVQIRSADRTTRDLHNRVSRVLNPGVGYPIAPNVFFAVPDQSAHLLFLIIACACVCESVSSRGRAVCSETMAGQKQEFPDGAKCLADSAICWLLHFPR